jgi:hypothetical protein
MAGVDAGSVGITVGSRAVSQLAVNISGRLVDSVGGASYP